MKRMTAKLGTIVMIIVIVGFQSLTPAATFAPLACEKARGNLSIVNNGNGTTSGSLTQSGLLNGTTEAVFTSVFTPTPDGFTFSFTDDLSVFTDKGILRTHNVGIFDTAGGSFSAINQIDPNSSTGRFQGSTGVLYVIGRTSDGGASFQAEILGAVCSSN